MPTIIILIIALVLLAGLSVNTVRATKSYNSSKSNTSSILQKEGGLGEDEAKSAVDFFLKIEGIEGETILIEEDKLQEKLTELGMPEEKIGRVTNSLRQSAAQELISELPKPGLTPSSRFYFLELWGEGIREFFAFSAQAKLKLHAERALERIAEVKAMLEEKEVNAKGLDVALARLETNVQKASKIIKAEQGKGREVSEVAKQLNAQLETKRMALNAVFEQGATDAYLKLDDIEKAAVDYYLKIDGIDGKAAADYYLKLDDIEKAAVDYYLKIDGIRGDGEKIFDEADQKLGMYIKLGDLPGSSDEGVQARKKIEPVPGRPTQSFPSSDASSKESREIGPVPSAGKGIEAGAAGGGGGAGKLQVQDYNSSISRIASAGKIREEIGNVLLRYGAGGAEINRVTYALEAGIDEPDLRIILTEIGINEEGIQGVLVELNRLGAKQK
ncbi:MAG: DUF5667 domain-containing protein [bacterium]|nr:DUF5667 domain-containing protein [bacterium]